MIHVRGVALFACSKLSNKHSIIPQRVVLQVKPLQCLQRRVSQIEFHLIHRRVRRFKQVVKHVRSELMFYRFRCHQLFILNSFTLSRNDELIRQWRAVYSRMNNDCSTVK